MSNAKIPLAAVIGSPIAHSKSPTLHGTWLRDLGIKGHYIPIDLASDDFETQVRAMYKMGFRGANVTIPYKQRALEMADEVSETARRIGAANTLTFSADGKIHADNTDAYGFYENIRASVPDWNAASGPALVLGAGGAARAIISALIDAHTPVIYLANRTKSRAEDLANRFGETVKVIEWDNKSTVVPDCATIVNTTSLGMNGNADVDIDLSAIKPTTVVNDIVYVPLETGLLRQARENGAIAVDGLGMLLHQAVPGFERWFDQKPEATETLREAMLK